MDLDALILDLQEAQDFLDDFLVDEAYERISAVLSELEIAKETTANVK